MVQPSHLFTQDRATLRSRSDLQKMIAAGTSDPAVFCNLGILCKSSGRIGEALDHYEQALEFEPDDPQIYSNIGNLYRNIGKLDQALQFTLKSLDLDHEASTVQMNLGSIYRDLGKTDAALTATIKAAYQQYFPKDPNGTSLSNWGEFESSNPSTFQRVRPTFRKSML
jgi:tetratricopeptide (TPR) repeat protein